MAEDGTLPEELSDAQLAELKRDLEEVVTRLEATLATSEDSSAPVDLDQPIGRVSRIDAIQQQQMASAGRRNHELRLHRSRAALARIDAGSFGECAECEEPIGYRRLKARPESRLCLECQRLQD